MAKDWTGERLETFVHNDSTIEHLHRYAIVNEYIKNKVVLDIACGEGYGSNLLAATARFVTGVDIDNKIIAHASQKYKKDNLLFKHGSVENIPFEDAYFDVVVSFETLEHVSRHSSMLSEIKRVMKPGGLLLLSTPNKKSYSDVYDYKNPFHKKELYLPELEKLLNEHFRFYSIHYQSIQTASLIINSSGNSLKLYEGDYHKISTMETIEPLYFIALCSDQALPTLPSSLFTSKGTLETAIREKELSVKNSLSYRIGHIILFPAKLAYKIFSKRF